MSDFLLNFASQVNVSRIVVSPSVKNALNSIVGGKSFSKKIRLDIDTKQLSQVSKLSEDLLSSLKNAVAKVKVKPEIAFDESKLNSFLTELEQIPEVLKVIKGGIAAIKANPSIIPNPVKEIGRLSALKTALVEVGREASKISKIQIRPEVRAFDETILKLKGEINSLQSQIASIEGTGVTAQFRRGELSTKVTSKQQELDFAFAGQREAVARLTPEVRKARLDELKRESEARNIAIKSQINAEKLAEKERISTEKLAAKEKISAEKLAAKEKEQAQKKITQQLAIEERQRQKINKLIEKATLDLEKQRNTINLLTSKGLNVPGVSASPTQLKQAATRQILGEGVDVSSLSGEALSRTLKGAEDKSNEARRALRDFNNDVRAVAAGTQSGFAAIAKYGDTAFERLGGRVGLASERVAAYIVGAAGLYTVASAIRTAITETALLEKEITNLQQIFDSGEGSVDDFTGRINDLRDTGAGLKKQFFELSIATGTSALNIAKSAKILAAAGFGKGDAGFESTIRAVTFAELGPSFGNTEEIIDGLIASINQFNLTLQETPYILGLVNETSKAYAVESQDLFEAVKRGGGSFAAVGGSLEDFITLVTVTREKTREAAPVIGTFIKTLSSKLFAPKANTLFKEIGVDADNVVDPFQRLVKLSEFFAKNNLSAAQKTNILSQIVDVRQAGRLAALIDGLDDFQKRANAIRAQGGLSLIDKAEDSLLRDFLQRVDDIGPAIERIKNGFTAFVEGIYNNQFTRGLLSIPAGLTTALSAVGQNKTAGNFANPLVFSSLILGLTGIIRGAIAAYRQNSLNVQSNTTSLNNLTAAIRTFSAGLTGTAGAAAVGSAGLAAGVAGVGRSGSGGRGIRGLFGGSGIFGSGVNPLLALGLASAVPGIINTAAPALGASPKTQSYLSGITSAATTGSLVGLAFGPKGALIGGVIGAVVGGITTLLENISIDNEIEKFTKQSRLSFGAANLEKSIRSGRPVNSNLNFGSLILQETFNKADAETKKSLSNLLLRGVSSTDQEGFQDEEFADLQKASAKVNALLRSIFLENLGPDTVENRRRAAKTTASQLSAVDFGGIQFSEQQLQKALAPLINSADSFEELTFSVKNLSEISTEAGLNLSLLSNSLTRTIDTQTNSIIKFTENLKRSNLDFSSIRNIISSAFSIPRAQALGQSASINDAKNVISRSGISPINVISPEIQGLAQIINGLISELASTENVGARSRVLSLLNDEVLRGIGGNTALEEGESENLAAIRGFQSTFDIAEQIRRTFGELGSIGPNSQAFLDILAGGTQSLPFNVKDIVSAIESKDIKAGERILGIEDSRRALIEQANALIDVQNFQLEQQLQIAEALVDATIKRREAQFEITKLDVDTANSILNLRSATGLSGSVESQNQAIQNQRILLSRGAPSDISGAGSLINQIKSIQVGVQRVIQSGRVGLGNINLPEIQSINKLLSQFGISGGISSSGSAPKIASDLATARALVEDSIQVFLNKAQDAFKILADEVDVVNNKIQSQRNTLESFIGQIFSGSGVDQALNTQRLQRSSEDARFLIAEVLKANPQFGALGTTQIETSQTIAQAVAQNISSFTSQQINDLRSFLQTVGSNEFAGTNVSGEELLAAIRASLAGRISDITGVAIGPKDIQTNAQKAEDLLRQLDEERLKRIQAQEELASTLDGNLSIIGSEVSTLTKAIAAIPSEIKLSITGVDNISVNFDFNQLDKSLNDVGNQVFNRINERLREAFRRSGISVPGIT